MAILCSEVEGFMENVPAELDFVMVDAIRAAFMLSIDKEMGQRATDRYVFKIGTQEFGTCT